MDNLNEYIRNLKESLTEDDMISIFDNMGVPYRRSGDTIRFKTCCHNENLSEAGYNLSLNIDGNFTCFSGCNCCMDVVEVVRRTRRVRGQDARLFPTLKQICTSVGVEFDYGKDSEPTDFYNWSGLKRYLKRNSNKDPLPQYDESILECFPKIVYEPWCDEYITPETQEKFGIRYYERLQQIIIPVWNYVGLCGIRVRNLLPEIVEEFGKYRPLELLSGTSYKFSSSLTLFNIDNLYDTDEAIIVESEKACMQLDSYGFTNGVGLFGKNFTEYHLKLLLKAGINKVVIALDADADENDIKKIVDRCKPFMQVFVIQNDLGEKFSPTDKGYDTWIRLYEKKVQK